jgi:hypothetical protein
VTIAPLTEIVLPHSAYHVAVGAAGHVVALSGKGAGSLISPDQRTITPFQVRFDPRGVSVSADGSVLAVTGRNEIAILSTSDLKTIHGLNDSFESCRFSANGLLWTCARLYSETVVLEIWEPKTWTRVARTKITDPYGGSCFDLLSHPDQNCVVAWPAAGQDGQCLFWARHHAQTIEVERFPELDCTTWPSFSPTRDELLVISGGELQRYGYPRGPISRRMEWPPEDQEDRMGDYVSYIDADNALVQSANGRLYLVYLQAMTIDEEVSLQGHEPKLASELYPNLKSDRALCSDLSFFLPFPGDQFLSVHREFPPVHPDDSHDHLLTWRIP